MCKERSLLGFMKGGLIDYLWTGVEATYIAIFATSFATLRSSYNTVLQHIPTKLRGDVALWGRSRFVVSAE